MKHRRQCEHELMTTFQFIATRLMKRVLLRAVVFFSPLVYSHVCLQKSTTNLLFLHQEIGSLFFFYIRSIAIDKRIHLCKSATNKEMHTVNIQ